MKIKEYQRKEEMLSALREAAINTIIFIMNDWDGYSDQQKLAAIDGVLNFMAGLDEDLAEEKTDAATT